MKGHPMTPEQLQSARVTLKTSQKDLAGFLGLTDRQIIRYENGQTKIPLAVAKLMEILLTRKIPKLSS
tara:strand:+ start:152 stop:355 length:204 start_codon:yes stop_codon:yes gene_type:complete